MANFTDDAGDFDVAAFAAKNQKQILIAVGAVLVIGAATWFTLSAQRLKEERAEQAFSAAERSFQGGNRQLAETDLGKIVQRYGGTSAGVRASILLAKNEFYQGKLNDGITTLRKAAGTGASGPFRAEIYALIGAGFENLTKYDSAAVSYAQASAAATIQADRDVYDSDQARTLGLAGKKADALKIWQRLAAKESSPVAADARLRAAELTATPAKGS